MLKGERGGECNRGVCKAPDAQWYNRSTNKYYCDDCAEVLNRVNAQDALRLFGGQLCIHSTESLEPQWVHDCEHCEFLGRYTSNGKILDLYFHPDISSRINTTVIARFGSDGWEYASGMGFAYGGINALTEARHRAFLRGLCTFDGRPIVEGVAYGSPMEVDHYARQNHNDALGNKLTFKESK